MARIGLNVFVDGLTGKLLIRWLEASAPLAEVGRSAAFDFPYDDVYAINDINPVVHIVQLWQSVDGTALTFLIREWNIDASVNNEIHSETFQYVVDRGWDNTAPVATGPEVWADPVDLDTELVDERLDGVASKAELVVHEAGYGNKVDAEYELRVGGGITLNDGKTFDSEVRWFITRHKTVAQTAPSLVNEQTGVQTLTADTDFFTSPTVNLYNKLIIINGSASVLQVTFPLFSTIPNGTRVTFNTHRGSQNYLTLSFAGSDSVYLNGTQRTKIYLAKGQEIKLFWDAGVCYVLQAPDRDMIRGQVAGDWQDRAGTTGAFLLANESTGLKTRTDYPGLVEWLLLLPPGVVAANDTEWNTNKRRWMLNATQFRVPHLADTHRRFRATTEVPGTYEADAMPDHDHLMFSVTDNGSPYASQAHSTGGNLGYNINGSSSLPSAFRTSKPYINGVIQAPSGIFETRVKNFKEIPLIVL